MENEAETVTFVEVSNRTKTIAKYFGSQVNAEISQNGHLIITNFQEAIFITHEESLTLPKKEVEKRRCINGKIFYNKDHWGIASKITMGI